MTAFGGKVPGGTVPGGVVPPWARAVAVDDTVMAVTDKKVKMTKIASGQSEKRNQCCKRG